MSWSTPLPYDCSCWSCLVKGEPNPLGKLLALASKPHVSFDFAPRMSLVACFSLQVDGRIGAGMDGVDVLEPGVLCCKLWRYYLMKVAWPRQKVKLRHGGLAESTIDHGSLEYY